MKSYDFIAIGGGNSGLTSTSIVAGAGKSTALIDRGPIGGLCSLNGCNPKKVLVRSSEVLDEINHASKFGIDVGDIRIDWRKVIDRKESFTRDVTAQSEESLKKQGIDFIQGAPKFISSNTLEVNGEQIEFGSIVIATGSYPRPLTFPGAELTKTSNDILALRVIPRHLVIIGSGVIAFEFGHVFARVGSKVTIITPGKRALSGEDEDMVNALVEFSITLGIELLTEVRIHSVSESGESLQLQCEAGGKSMTFESDFILNAAGRVHQ